MKKQDLISLIVPCYNEEESIPLFMNEIRILKDKMTNLNFEIIFVDDGSNDGTLSVLRKFNRNYSEVKYISFSKNFGKEYAMLAGFEFCNGDYIAAIDVDLQHPPMLIEKMYSIIKKENCDCVAAKGIKRKKSSFIRKCLTKIYYKMINTITEVEMVENATDYRLMTRQMMEAITSVHEHNRYLKGIFEIVGFQTKWIEYKEEKRVVGKTKWSIGKLFKYAITGIISFSQFPIIMILYLGIFFASLFIMLLIIMLFIYILKIDTNLVIWWITSIVILLIATILCSNGILGLYIAQIQTESKKRPLFIIKEKNI